MSKLMRSIFHKLCLIALLVAVATPTPATAHVAAADHTHISNFAQVAPNLYRGAQPSSADIYSLKRLGIRTIIDLRIRHDAMEEKQAQRLGLKWIHVPMNYLTPSDKQVAELMSVLTSPDYGKIFVHCAQGADRTGAVVVLYRIVVQDWPLDKVFDEMRDHHFKPWCFLLKDRVALERQRLDRCKKAAEATLGLRVDPRRMLLDRAANESVRVAASDSDQNHD
jgi:protein tyrosine/serine phosphatase